MIGDVELGVIVEGLGIVLLIVVLVVFNFFVGVYFGCRFGRVYMVCVVCCGGISGVLIKDLYLKEMVLLGMVCWLWEMENFWRVVFMRVRR